MLENILSKLGAGTKITVGVSVSPNVGLEMAQIDRFSNTIVKYGVKPLEYNHSTREIADYAQFEASLLELFDELEISPKSNVILSLPNVHYGLINLPVLLDDEAITNAIISDVEQSYIFKRQEPVISWTEVLSTRGEIENRRLIYSAVQQAALDEIINIFESIGCTLAAVETSYTPLLRALSYTNITKDQMREDNTWNLLLIGQNSYSILSLVGKKIVEYYEEPLALKSFIDDEIYSAIITSAMLTLSSLPANNITVISETNMVSAEILAMKMSNDVHIDFLECNKFAQNELLPVNISILPELALQITPEIIGALVYPYYDFPIKMNLSEDVSIELSQDETKVQTITIGNLEIELTPNFIKKIIFILTGLILTPLTILFIWLSFMFLPQETAKLDNLTAQATQVQSEIDRYKKSDKQNSFDLSGTIEKIISQNKTKLGYYRALGMSVPNNLWITYYVTNESGKIDIKGRANNVESVYSFYKSLKELINNSDIRLHKLEVNSESIDDIIANTNSGPKNYIFEITNMSETELNPPAPSANTQQTQQQPIQAPQPEQKPGFQLGKPLFGPKTDSNPLAPTMPNPTNKVAPAGKEQLPSNLKSIEKF